MIPPTHKNALTIFFFSLYFLGALLFLIFNYPTYNLEGKIITPEAQIYQQLQVTINNIIAVSNRFANWFFIVTLFLLFFTILVWYFILKTLKIRKSYQMEIENKNLALQSSETFLDTIIKNLPLFILVRDATNKEILLENQTYRANQGYINEDIIGKKTEDFIGRIISEEDAAITRETDKKVIETKQPIVVPEYTLISKSGKKRTLKLKKVPVFDEEGEPLYIITIGDDITEWNQVQEEIKRKNEELERSRQFLLDAQEIGHISSFELDFPADKITGSAELFRIIGIDPEDVNYIKYSVFSTYFHPEDTKRITEALENTIKYKTIFDIQHRFIRANAEIVHVWSRGKAVFDEEGNAQLLIGAIMDITELKQKEEQLQKNTEKLLHLNEDLEQVAFISAHDLLEPLRMLSNYIKLLERNSKNNLDGDSLEYMKIAVENASRMHQLISALQLYMSIDIKSTDFQPVNMNEILQEVLQRKQQFIDDNKTTIIINNELPVINAKAEQINLLLDNLLDNAIKFKHTNAPEIIFNAKEMESERQISVKDNGIGMDDKYADRIFLIFKRLHTKEEYSGTGIGLAIAKKVVEHHGGKIWYESTAGEGTTFYFTIKKELVPSQVNFTG